MEYLLAYDIVKDDLRKEVAEICLNKGMTRIQYSVFFGNVSRNIIETILMEIKEISKGEQLELIICQMCEKCSKKKIIYISEEKSGKKRSVKENGIEDENDEIIQNCLTSPSLSCITVCSAIVGIGFTPSSISLYFKICVGLVGSI